MSALLALITSPKVVAWVAAALGFLGLLFQQRRAGAKAERAKQEKKEQRARDIAEDVENDIGTIPPDRRREELGKWSDD